MKRARRPSERRESAASGASPLAELFESFVSLDVECARERRLQAQTIAALVGLGLLAAVVAPLTVVAGLGVLGALLPTLLAAALLAGAASLSASGRFDFLGGGLALALALSGAAGLAFADAVPAPLSILAIVAGALGAGALLWHNAHRRRRPAETATHGGAGVQAVLCELAGPLYRFDPAGRLLEVPDGASLLGPEEGAAGPLLERVHLVDRLGYLDAFADLRRGAPSAEVELRLVAGEAGHRHVVLRLAGVPGIDGEPASVLGLARDVTAEREAAARLALTLARAEEASEAKSRFLAAISHELRTPLNAIIGFTDILDQEFFGGFESPRQKEYVNLIARSGGHLLAVVNGLLDISKIEAGRYEILPERFPVREAMEAAAAMMRAEAGKKGVVLIVQEPAEGLLFRADRRAFHQILLNLLSNAVKFTDEGCVRLSARVEGGMQIVEVEDTGLGIAPGDMARIAQPFVRIQNGDGGERPGTGLGLSLVKGLCELHEGALRLESRPGVGTTASAAIPVDCPERGLGEQNLKEKVVSLTDARKKTVPLPQTQAGRRSA